MNTIENSSYLGLIMQIPSNQDDIIVYKSNPCGYCNAAIRFLQEHKGKNITIIDLTGNHEARVQLMKTTGLRTVPQIFIAGVHIGGYDEMRKLDSQGKLDELLRKVT